MRLPTKNILTKLTGLVILLIVLVTQFQQRHWNKEEAIITGDVRVYYIYLPALFIHDDLALENVDAFRKGDKMRILYAEDNQGKRYIRSTCGMALVYSPFFLLGHAGAYFLNEPMDGFSYPYLFALAMGAVVYMAIGILFLSKLLLRFFDDRVVSITLLILYLGTNLLFYYTGTMLYSHGFSFTLLTVFLYASMRWLDQPAMKWAVVLGLTSGLLVLIRPIDIIFVLTLPLVGIFSFDQFKLRIQLLWKKKNHILLSIGVALIVMIPQFAYNYHIWGKLIFNMYSHTGETFYFNNPHLLDTLFSYRNGWLIYSPLMIFSIIGFYFLLRNRNHWAWYLVPICLIYYFILSSWWCWWYAGFGNRAFINLYPLLAFPLAACVYYCSSRRFVLRSSFKVVVLAGILLSLFQTKQFSDGYLHWGDMTKEAYWDLFLKESPSELYTTYLRSPIIKDQINGLDRSYRAEVKHIYTHKFDFEMPADSDSSFAPYFVRSNLNGGNRYLKIPNGIEYLGDLQIPPNDKINEIYVTAWVKGVVEGETFITISNSEQSFVKISQEFIQSVDGWDQIHSYATVPESVLGDTLHFKIWNHGKMGFLLDNVHFSGRHRSFHPKVEGN